MYKRQRERHVIAPVPFTLEVKVVLGFVFPCEEIEKITFCTTYLGLSRSQGVRNFVGAANHFNMCFMRVIGLNTEVQAIALIVFHTSVTGIDRVMSRRKFPSSIVLQQVLFYERRLEVA